MNEKSSWRKWYEKNRERANELKRAQMRRARAEKPDVYNAHSRRAKVKEKLRLFEMYGKSCARCGFDDMRALSLDHINNDGNEQRRKLGERGVYRDAKKDLQPDKYQILCMNCQFIKRVEHSGHVDLNLEWQQQHSPNYHAA